MISESSLQNTERIADRFMRAGLVFGVLSMVPVMLAMILPIKADTEALSAAEPGDFKLRAPPEQDLKALLVRMAGRPLIRPAQVHAAVKDTGAAGRLLKKLKLHGVVRMGDELVAYIQVDKEGVKTLRSGETVLDFVVRAVEPGRVTLSLEGVEVALGQ